ncbi:MAG: type IV conjugative transfer system coupling protein TraD [Proteobacteria bacterium]|nr:type IV conjugative transfer system coupling protein TraD [Pseudomonadota bacterium]
MSRYPIDALLRPPVELWSVLVALVAALIAATAPWALMLPDAVGYGVCACLVMFAALRARQAWRVIRYQRRLKRMPSYRLYLNRVPLSRHKLFLGRGFLWTQQHTQRLRDTLRPEVQHYVQPHWLYRWARRMEVQWESKRYLSKLANLLRSRRWWNPLAPIPLLGGNPALHAVGIHEQDVWMDLDERVGHTLVLGTTRVGKTRLAELLIAQDIRRGDVVIVFDPKGDAGLLKRVYAEAKRNGREKDFSMFHLGYPEASVRYNAIGNFSRITEVATRIANQLPREGNSAAFKEFAWRFVNIIARALVGLGHRPDYEIIRRYINDIEPLFIRYAKAILNQQGKEGWQEEVVKLAASATGRHVPHAMRGRQAEAIALTLYLQGSDIYEPVLDGLMSAFKYDRTYFDKIVSSVGPLLEKLTTGKIAKLLSPDVEDQEDERAVLEWMQVIRNKGIVYVGLDALSDTTVASAVGNSMFADLVSVAGHIYKHGVPGTKGGVPTISLHADEFNELIGDEFVPLLNKAGGAGFQVTAYTQTWSDVEARLGNSAKAGQVAGNFNTLIMLRVKELATARMLTDQLPNVDVLTLMSVSGVDDSSDPGSGVDFKSRNEDRISVSEVGLLGVSELVTLPKGQAFAMLSGGQLWKLRMPLADNIDDAALPQAFRDLAREMERSYITNDYWYRQRETWWLETGQGAANREDTDGEAADTQS